VHLLTLQQVQGRFDVLHPRVRACLRSGFGRLDAFDHAQGDLAGIDLRAQPEESRSPGQRPDQMCDLGELLVAYLGGRVGSRDGLLVVS
jgi:hypothetical protein